jgi:hypothetical protein
VITKQDAAKGPTELNSTVPQADSAKNGSAV